MLHCRGSLGPSLVGDVVHSLLRWPRPLAPASRRARRCLGGEPLRRQSRYAVAAYGDSNIRWHEMWAGREVLALHLLPQGLQGEADSNHNAEISALELADFVSELVPKISKDRQLPIHESNGNAFPVGYKP